MFKKKKNLKALKYFGTKSFTFQIKRVNDDQKMLIHVEIKSHQDLRIIQKILTNVFKKEITANLYQVVPFILFKILLIKLSVNTKINSVRHL